MRHIYLSTALCLLAFAGTQANAQESAPAAVACLDNPQSVPCVHSCVASGTTKSPTLTCKVQQHNNVCHHISYSQSQYDSIPVACEPKAH